MLHPGSSTISASTTGRQSGAWDCIPDAARHGSAGQPAARAPSETPRRRIRHRLRSGCTRKAHPRRTRQRRQRVRLVQLPALTAWSPRLRREVPVDSAIAKIDAGARSAPYGNDGAPSAHRKEPRLHGRRRRASSCADNCRRHLRRAVPRERRVQGTPVHGAREAPE
jgi:hypothetical protein